MNNFQFFSLPLILDPVFVYIYDFYMVFSPAWVDQTYLHSKMVDASTSLKGFVDVL